MVYRKSPELDSTINRAIDNSAGVPPAVAGAARPRFGEVQIRDRGHLLRNDTEFERAVLYVGNNPLKAGLRNWPWVWVCGRDAHTAAGGTPALPGKP
jgi:hypothetical protein